MIGTKPNTAASAISLALVLILSYISKCHAQFNNTFPIAEPSPESGYNSKIPLDFTPFNEAIYTLSSNPTRLEELDNLLLPESVSLSDIQDLLSSGETTSTELVTYYIHRIKTYDVGVFNSVAQLNPSALNDAKAIDEARDGTGAANSLMHGIPILLKWNIAISSLSTTAGSAALKDWIPTRDASLVATLRANGAIVLGHANLSEFANYLSPSLPDGFSALAGQTRAAYGLYDPWGSSTGSAVAVGANFIPVAVGTETSGSIIMPSNVESVVGLRPSTGLVSGDYVVPLCLALDTAGPMAKNVGDLAVVLSAMTEGDGVGNDALWALKDVDFTRYITHEAVDGPILVGIPYFSQDDANDPRLQYGQGELDEATINFWKGYFQGENEKYAKVGDMLLEAGNGTIQTTTYDAIDLMLGYIDIGRMLEYCMKDSFDTFASQLSSDEPTFPRKSLEEVVDFNNQDPNNYIPYGQGYLEASVNTNVTLEEFEELSSNAISQAQSILDAIFNRSRAHVILNDMSQTYSIAGYPALTIPGGYESDADQEIPVGTIFNAPHLGDAKLIQVGYIYEQETKFRVNPDLEAVRRDILEGLENKGGGDGNEGVNVTSPTSSTSSGESNEGDNTPSPTSGSASSGGESIEGLNTPSPTSNSAPSGEESIAPTSTTVSSGSGVMYTAVWQLFIAFAFIV